MTNIDIDTETGTGKTSRVGNWRLAAFAAIIFPLTGAGLPIAIHLPAIYSQHFGISLGAIGAVFLFGRLWDAISDPLIGTLSDRTRTRFGRRRPYMVAGCVLFAVASALLFFPPDRISPAYLGIALFLCYLGWTMVQIPFLAWSGELSRDYNERTRIVSFQQIAMAVAVAAVLILPTVVDQVRPGDGRFKLTMLGGFILVTLVPGLLLTLSAFREPPLPPTSAQPRPSAGIGFLFRDRLLLRVLGSDFAVTLAQYLRMSLFVFFVVFYMGLPQWASGLFLFQFVVAIFAGPIWLKVGYRLGKHRAAVLGECLQVLVNLGLLFIAPGNIALLVFLTAAQGLTQNSGNQMLRAIVADVADQHRLETGADRTGLFFSVFSLSGKAASAGAVGVALPLVAWLGFDPTRANDASALFWLKIVFALGPALAHGLSALLIVGFPLDQRRHAEVRKALDDRDRDVPTSTIIAQLGDA